MEAGNKKYLRLGAAVFAALAAAILLYFFLLRFEKVKALFDIILSALQPLFVGIVMAYLLCPVVRFWERRCSRVRFLSRIARPLSVFATMFLTASVLGMFCALVMPQLVESITNLAGDLPGLLKTQFGRLDAFLKSDSDAASAVMQMVSSAESFLADWIRTELFSTVSVQAGNILSVGSAAVNLCVSVVVAVYLLLDRERYLAQCRKLFHSVSPNERVNRAVSDFVRQTDKIFSGFISGKLLDSLIIGIICYFCLLILKMPYTVIMALCELGVGILLLVNPIGFTQWIFIVLGIVLLGMGVLEIIAYFRMEPGRAFGKHLATGLAEIAAGLFCVFQYGWFIVTFPLFTILYGVLILLTGFLKVQWAVDMIRMKQGKWYLAAISALLSLAFAWIILSNPFASTAALWMFVAVFLIVEAFVDVFVLLFRKKVLEQGDSSV